MVKKVKKKTLSLTEKQKNDIIAIVSLGCTRKTAARYVSCPVSLITQEIRRSKKFADKLFQAEEQSEIFFLRQIQKAAVKEQYWRAAAWVLERRYPERYAARGTNFLSWDEVKTVLSQIIEVVFMEINDVHQRENILDKFNTALSEFNDRRSADNTLFSDISLISDEETDN